MPASLLMALSTHLAGPSMVNWVMAPTSKSPFCLSTHWLVQVWSTGDIAPMSKSVSSHCTHLAGSLLIFEEEVSTQELDT